MRAELLFPFRQIAFRRIAFQQIAKLAALSLIAAGGQVAAQTCTTQARMQPAVRAAIAEAALTLGTAIKSGDSASVKGATVSDLAANFAGTESLIRSTTPKLGGDTLHVSQVYELNASGRKATDTTSADFNCALKDTDSETDFSITGLPPGDFGFAMVEAAGGEQPWLLSLLLQKDGATWKMAGFYPRARSAAGHDGIWYWTAARERAAAKQSLLAWLYYNQASALLQPAPFASSTNLDKLRTEQRTAAPQEIADGISTESPLALKGVSGPNFKITSLAAEPAVDGKSLHLVVHLASSGAQDDASVRARSEAAARALVGAHPELKGAYSSVFVFEDVPQGNPPVVSLNMGQIQ